MVARVEKVGPQAIREAAELVARGGVIVYPTDTVYGLGCDPKKNSAVERVFEVKQRVARPIPIICASLERAAEIVLLQGTALKLAEKYWPGPLTIVAPISADFSPLIDQGTGSVGVRVPALQECVRLLEACGGFLTGTSANISGRPACVSAEDASRELGDVVDMILDGGVHGGSASTVVKVGQNGIDVLREGPIRVTDEIERE
jgi:L-threonylcarbamoyladenylate synthase